MDTAKQTLDNEHLRRIWGQKSLAEIGAEFGLTKQAVSRRGRKLGLPALRGGRRPGEGLVTKCAGCGEDFKVKNRAYLRKQCPTCLKTQAQTSLCGRAYHLRRVTGWTWNRIADGLNYRPGKENRGVRLIGQARDYAIRHGFTWPIKQKADA